MKTWTPPPSWSVIKTIDAHAAGEPLRVILEGFPSPSGDTILARRRDARERFDHWRTALLWEPRGHADMYGCLLTPPVTPGADLGVLFLHNEGYSTMCGHGIIALTTVVLEIGLIPKREPETPLLIDTPAGPVAVRARVSDGRIQSVAFRNVPSFAVALDEAIDVPGFGRVRYDLAYGGAFYAFVHAEEIGLTCTPNQVRSLTEAGMAIKRAVAATRPIRHPLEDELSFLYGTIFIGRSEVEGVHSRHVCIFAEGEVDRSPTGTGVSARLALLSARGEITLGESLAIESIIGSRFTGRIVDMTTVGPYPAVIPEIEGTAYITGRHEFFFDPHDELRLGFLLR